MTRSEITKELEDLSKRAKELGFPQEVKEGDWQIKDKEGYVVLVDKVWLDELKHYIYTKQLALDDYTLILSFSRCLEWLAKRSWILRLPYQKDLMRKDVEFSEWFDGEFTKQEVFIKGYLFMENPDLWVAKAVVEILEGENESK